MVFVIAYPFGSKNVSQRYEENPTSRPFGSTRYSPIAGNMTEERGGIII